MLLSGQQTIKKARIVEVKNRIVRLLPIIVVSVSLSLWIGYSSKKAAIRARKFEPTAARLDHQLEFAGGATFNGPWGEVNSANITPDASGIGYYDEALFIKTLRTGHVGARQLSSIMPWGYFRNMTDEDLSAIFAYLRTLTPVKHRVDNTELPTECPVCRRRHGHGEMNQ